MLAAHLRTLADAESITVSDPALRLIARAGEGSVRDSVALLDQLATFGGGTISDQDASHLLGGVDAAIFHRLLAAMVGGEPATVSATVAEIERRGWDPRNVFGQFLAYARDALHLAMGGEPESVDLPGEDAAALAELVRPLGYENLLRLTQHLLASEPTVRRSELGSLALEIAWLRAAELPKLILVEELLAGKANVKLPAAARVPPAVSAPEPSQRRPPENRPPENRPPENRPPENRPPKNRPPEPPQPTAPDPPPAAVPEPQAPLPAEPLPAEPPGARLARFKELLSGRRQALAALLNGAELVFRDGELVIYASSGDALIQRALERRANAELLRELLREVWGEGVGFRICDPGAQAATDLGSPLDPPVPGDPPPDPAGEEPAAPSRDEEFARVRENPAVQAVLEIFDGTIRSVRAGAP